MIISGVDRHESLRLRKLNDLRNQRKQLQTRDQQHEPSTELDVLLLDYDSDASKSSSEDYTDNEVFLSYQVKKAQGRISHP